MKYDHYGREDSLERLIQNVEDSKSISESNEEIVKKFRDEAFSEELELNTVLRHLQALKTIVENIDFDLESADKKQLKRLIGRINRNKLNGSDYSASTIIVFRKAIRKLYTYLGRREDTDFFTVTLKKKDESRVDPEDIPSPKEIRDMARASLNPRDRCLLLLTYESCARIGETLALNIGDITLGKKLTTIHLKGTKTKKSERDNYIYLTSGSLREWLEAHPNSGDKNAPLFVNIGNKRYGKRLKYNSARRVFHSLGERSEVDCKTNPHIFRAARASHLAAQGFNQAQIEDIGGWERGSDKVAYYVRLGKKDKMNSIIKHYGIDVIVCPGCGYQNDSDKETCKRCGVKLPEENGDNGNDKFLGKIKCPRCGKLINGSKDMCEYCNLPLSDNIALKEDEEVEEADKELSILLENPEVQEALKNAMRKNNFV